MFPSALSIEKDMMLFVVILLNEYCCFAIVVLLLINEGYPLRYCLIKVRIIIKYY